MLGTTLDYFVLRALAHRRNRATEEQLDSRFGGTPAGSTEEATRKLHKLVDRFAGRLQVDPGLRYLDLGCGSGELTLAFAKLGIRRITGVDFLPRNIERARACAARAGAGEGVQFVCSDLHEWSPDGRYDVLLSFDALEHVDAPAAFLRKMTDFIAPGGVAALAFGPLFHSPFGDHMWDFFRLQLPWRGILFSEQALLRVRKECFRPTDPARRYAEVAGGLNLLRYSDFLKHVRDTGWEFDYLAVNTFLRRVPPLRMVSDLVTRVPGLRDYFVHNVYAVLRRAVSPGLSLQTGNRS
jgi:SAM-dependent methyltransferase